MLKQVTQRVWCLPWEEERDRPSLYYIRGDRRSLAVDAGSSPAHVAQFYAALEKRGLPLPDFTAVTHWHWDHTFGLGAVQGVTLASALANRKLRQVRAWEWTPEAMAQRERRGEDIPFCNEHIRREYPDLGAVSVSLAEMEVEGELTLHLGGVDCRLLCRDTPHSRDGLLVHVPQEGVLALGDADCEDLYQPGAGYDPARLRALLELLSSLEFSLALPGHSGPETRSQELEYLRGCLQGCAGC